MTALRTFIVRLLALFGAVRRDTELNDEIQTHLDRLADEHRRRGMSPADARLAARREFGGVDQVKETYRDQRGLRFLESLTQDARYALRTLRRSPGFTAVAVLTLALGIGINATVFTVTNAALFKGFPFVDGNDRILYVERHGAGFSYPDFEDWRAQAKSFEGMAAATAWLVNFSDNGKFPEVYAATVISANAFRLIGQRPVLGRDFASSDETPGAAPVAILSYRLWERRYGKDPAILGQTVRIEISRSAVLQHDTAIVIGVMGQGFAFPFSQDLWVPLVPPNLQKRDARNITFFFGRMAEGVTTKAARVEMDTIGRRLASAYPIVNSSIAVQNFNEHFIGPRATLLFESMVGAVGFVLLIACANLANLMLARAIGRSREMSVRIALGAGRWRIIRQLLVESVMLSATGGVVGWWVATWGVRAYPLAGFAPFQYPHDIDLTMDYRVLGYLIAISIGTGLLFGLAPASRLSKLDVNGALKDGGRGVTGGGRGRHLSALLVVGEMALAVVLLAGAGMMIRSFLNIYTADAGIRTTNVLTATVLLPVVRYPSAEAQISFYDRLTTRLEGIPGVESIAMADRFPTQGARRLPYELAGASPADEQRRPTISAVVVSPAYFRTLGAAVLSGREFTDADDESGVPVVLVNQRFASTYWPGEDPLGKRLRLFGGRTPDAWLTVVGVTSNIVQTDRTRQEFDPLVYVPYRQNLTGSGAMYMFARTHVPPGSLESTLHREIQTLDSDLPISFLPLGERLASNYRDNGVYGVVLAIFAVLALLLAAIGLYAVIAHSVSQRSQEIGIRMAMGATARDIVTLVFTQGMLPVSAGLTIGLAGALAVTPVMKSQLVQVSPADPITLVVASGTLIVSALFGCWIPARRAMRVDPVIALRHE